MQGKSSSPGFMAIRGTFKPWIKGVGIFLVAAALIAGMTGCPPGPTEIHDWYDLHAIRDNPDDSYVLMNDLNSTTAGYMELAGPTANAGRGWDPIGASDTSFTGSFNGQGHEIRNLYIDRPNEDYVGLFACVSWTRHIENVGVIENIGVINADVTGNTSVGALVGHNGGIVINSYSTGSVTGHERVGGLVGWNQHTLMNSYASCSVSGQIAVGGLAGDNWLRATVSNSHSSGSVTGSSKVGGLVGWSYYGSVTNSYSTASVTGSSRVGGLVGGSLGGIVNSSFWDMVTSAMGVSEGGTGKTTAEMRNIGTFTDTTTAGLEESWDIVAVTPGATDSAYAWNIVDGQTYPFLGWQPVA